MRLKANVPDALARTTGLLSIARAALLCAVLAVSVAHGEDDSGAARALVAQAVHELDSATSYAQVGAAQGKLREALRLDPRNAPAMVEMARVEMKSGAGDYDYDSFRRAADWIAKAIAIAPDFGNAYVLQGYVFTHLQRNDEAQKAFDRAAQLGADSPWLEVNRADLLAQTGKSQQAETEYRFAATAANKPADVRAAALRQLGVLYTNEAKYDDAKRTYQRMLALDPGDAHAMCKLAAVLRFGLLELDESEKWGRGAMKNGMGCENLALTLYLKWAEALITEKNAAKAQQFYDEASSLGVDPVELLHEVRYYPRPHPIIDALRQKGYSMDKFAATPGGDTPLTIAVKSRNRAIVRQLVDAGAKVDTPGYEGYTPLMVAVGRNDIEMVKLLLSLGANPATLSVENDDAEKMATDHGYADVAALIAKAKAQNPAHSQAPARNPEAPFRGGWLYRVKRDLHNGWTDPIKVGEELIYAMPGNATDPNIALFMFYPASDARYKKTWGIDKQKLASWPEYLEEVGPWQSNLK